MKFGGIEDSSILKGKSIMTIFLLIAQAMILLEFVFYVVMFQSLREKNKSLINIVQDDILKVSGESCWSFGNFGLIS